MSNFVIGVGGSGAKLVQSLVHLSAAGLLPENRRELYAYLVDPDENNGNVEDCQTVVKYYRQCRETVKVGKCDLFNGAILLNGPWTPLTDPSIDSLREIYNYDRLLRADSEDAELLDLMFEGRELRMSIRQGFRGRPAVGATVFANAVNFEESSVWSELREQIRGRATQGRVHLLLGGSVFGGSGASGVPTLVRLLNERLSRELSNLRTGMVLFLPFFQFRPVPGEEIQADPAAFPMATAEALKYYHERGFLEFCRSIYTAGEEIPSDVAVAAVGASEQRNEAHFLELVLAMGAVRFFSDAPSRENTLAVAARRAENTLAWRDLPYDEHLAGPLVHKLQQLAVFAVSYRYLFYPVLVTGLSKGKSDASFFVDHVSRPGVNLEQAGIAFRNVYDYLEKFLVWLMNISTPRREGFSPGLVNPNVFATSNGSWRLKSLQEFRDSDLASLLLNRSSKAKIDSRSVYGRAGSMSVRDPDAAGPGRLIRALYDACAVE